MHPRVLAERGARARARLLELAKTLGSRFDVDEEVAALTVTGVRDPASRALYELEALVGLLEAVAGEKAPVVAKAKTEEPAAPAREPNARTVPRPVSDRARTGKD